MRAVRIDRKVTGALLGSARVGCAHGITALVRRVRRQRVCVCPHVGVRARWRWWSLGGVRSVGACVCVWMGGGVGYRWRGGVREEGSARWRDGDGSGGPSSPQTFPLLHDVPFVWQRPFSSVGLTLRATVLLLAVTRCVRLRVYPPCRSTVLPAGMCRPVAAAMPTFDRRHTCCL